MKTNAMEAIRIHRTIKHDGEIRLTGLPCQKGQSVDVILIIGQVGGSQRRELTARELRRSGLVGLWQKRKGTGSSPAFARRLREAAQKR